jgi:UDP:flavonoid glycosyltransferase YjiC (YdhE family)
MRFEPAPEYDVFPTLGRYLKPYEAVVRAAEDTRPLIRELRPDIVVADILTLAPALAAEREGVRSGTLIPHLDPRPAPGFPPYSIGARLPRTPVGRAVWGAFAGIVERGLLQGQRELNDTRERLGLPRLDYVHGGISREFVLVATFPQLEYPRPEASAPNTHVVGPLQWEPPYHDVELPPGDGPLVLVAPSTSQDAEQQLLRASLEGLADLPVRVLGTWNRRPPPRPLPAPRNARVVEWLSYARTMPACDALVCHGGHGTVMRALTSGCAVVAVPAAGDMNENAARLDWAGVGVRLPRRSVTPRAIRLAVGRALDDGGLRRRVSELATWAAASDPADRAAALVEQFASR